MSLTDWMEWAWGNNWDQSGYEVPTCPGQLPVWPPALPSACYAGDVVGIPPPPRHYPQPGDIAITPKHGPTQCYDTDAGYVRHVPCASGPVPTVGGRGQQPADCTTYSFAAHERKRAQDVLRLRRTPHVWRRHSRGGGATAFVPLSWLMLVKGEAERLHGAFRAAGVSPGMVLGTSPCPDDAPRFQDADTVGSCRSGCCIPAYDWRMSTDFPVSLPHNPRTAYIRPNYLPAFADPTAVMPYTCAGPAPKEAWLVPGGTAPKTREVPQRELAGAATLATRLLRGRSVTAAIRGILQRRFPNVRFRIVSGYSCHTEERGLNTVRICVDGRGRFLSAQVG